MQIQVNHLDELPAAAAQVLHYLHAENVKFVALDGEMGAGKTTLIVEIIKQMGVKEAGSSPTFSILNEYFSLNYGIVYHFDFYRIKDEIEAYDIGVEEIFEADAYVFIEWPERIVNLIPEHHVSMKISVENEQRTIELEVL